MSRWKRKILASDVADLSITSKSALRNQRQGAKRAFTKSRLSNYIMDLSSKSNVPTSLDHNEEQHGAMLQREGKSPAEFDVGYREVGREGRRRWSVSRIIAVKEY